MTQLPSEREIEIIDPSRSHIPALDGVRGVAILMVIAVHAYYRGPNVSDSLWIKNFLVFGWTGVELFFVLSGFLITSLIRNDISQPHGLRNFFVKRASRIFPIYYGILIALFLISFAPLPKVVDESLANYKDNFAIYWLFLSNFSELLGIENNPANKILGPAWSLAIEQQYYLFWPLCLLGLSRRHVKYLPIAAFIGMSIARLFFANRLNSTIVYHATFFHADGILVGSAIALWMPSLMKIRRLLPLLLLVSFSIMVLVFFVADSTHYSNPIVQVYGYGAISIFYGIAILNIITSKNFSKLFCSKILTTAGKYAYFIYLVHWPFLLAIDQLPLPQGWVSWGIFYLLFSASMIAVGSLSWHQFELPISRLIRSRFLKI